MKFDHCLNELTLCLIKKKEKKKEGPWWNKEPSLACRLSKFDKDFIFSAVYVRGRESLNRMIDPQMFCLANMEIPFKHFSKFTNL